MLRDCNNLFSFNRVNEPVECPTDTDNILYTIDNLNEGVPYSVKKNILDEKIYYWNSFFISKVLESFSSTIVQKFSEEEQDLFDRYRSFLIYEVQDVVDEDVQKLDEYIGTLGVNI